MANLRPHDIEEPDKDLKFDKYYSKGEMRQTYIINDIKSVI